MLTYPKHYHDKNQEVWLTATETPVATENMPEDIKSFRDIFSKWLPLGLATSNDHIFNTFWMTVFI